MSTCSAVAGYTSEVTTVPERYLLDPLYFIELTARLEVGAAPPDVVHIKGCLQSDGIPADTLVQAELQLICGVLALQHTTAEAVAQSADMQYSLVTADTLPQGGLPCTVMEHIFQKA